MSGIQLVDAWGVLQTPGLLDGRPGTPRNLDLLCWLTSSWETGSSTLYSSRLSMLGLALWAAWTGLDQNVRGPPASRCPWALSIFSSCRRRCDTPCDICSFPWLPRLLPIPEDQYLSYASSPDHLNLQGEGAGAVRPVSRTWLPVCWVLHPHDGTPPPVVSSLGAASPSWWKEHSRVFPRKAALKR